MRLRALKNRKYKNTKKKDANPIFSVIIHTNANSNNTEVQPQKKIIPSVREVEK
jgi:hypothetical protein